MRRVALLFMSLKAACSFTLRGGILSPSRKGRALPASHRRTARRAELKVRFWREADTPPLAVCA